MKACSFYLPITQCQRGRPGGERGVTGSMYLPKIFIWDALLEFQLETIESLNHFLKQGSEIHVTFNVCSNVAFLQLPLCG